MSSRYSFFVEFDDYSFPDFIVLQHIIKFLNTIVGALVLEKEEEFTLSLYALQQQPKFNLMLFESEIDKIRLCVAEVGNIAWFLIQ